MDEDAYSTKKFGVLTIGHNWLSGRRDDERRHKGLYVEVEDARGGKKASGPVSIDDIPALIERLQKIYDEYLIETLKDRLAKLPNLLFWRFDVKEVDE